VDSDYEIVNTSLSCRIGKLIKWLTSPQGSYNA